MPRTQRRGCQPQSSDVGAPCCAAGTKAPLPQWVIMEASSVALKLRAQQATRHFFCDLAGLLSCVAHACASAGVLARGLKRCTQADAGSELAPVLS